MSEPRWLTRARAMGMPDEGCWVWTAARNSAGYGHVGINGRTYYVHRLMYEHAKGPIPEGLSLDHLCRTPACFRPDHLEAVTHRENVIRGAAVITVCPQGHPYSGDNVYIGNRGARHCRTCSRESCRRYYARRKAEALGAVG